MKTFKDLKFKDHSNGLMFGIQARVDFKNGYGASIVKGPHTYGGKDGLYELAVFKDNNICYDTPVTNDVLGHLSEDEVTFHLNEIENLQSK